MIVNYGTTVGRVRQVAREVVRGTATPRQLKSVITTAMLMGVKRETVYKTVENVLSKAPPHILAKIKEDLR